jgi:endonuclease III
MEKPVVASAAKKAKAKVRPASAKAKGEGGASKLTPAEIHEVFSRFAATMPHPKTELEYVNPFTLLVAVVLSARRRMQG